jgi:hypothetical protein
MFLAAVGFIHLFFFIQYCSNLVTMLVLSCSVSVFSGSSFVFCGRQYLRSGDRASVLVLPLHAAGVDGSSPPTAVLLLDNK